MLPTTVLCSTALIASCLAMASIGALGESTDASVKWGYDASNPDQLQPDQWGTKFPTCDGKRQSPVDLSSPARCTTDDERTPPLRFDGSCGSFHLKQHDDVFKGEVQNGTCTVTPENGKPFSLLQFHMHSPSEHKIDGKAFDAEAHFVHKNDHGLLVVGLFIEKQDGTETNPWIKNVWNQLDHVATNTTAELELDSYQDLLRASMETGSIFHYAGSLTTPPCDEIADWWVLREPVVVSSADFGKFVQHAMRLPALDDGQGARPTQPLNGRKVQVF